MGESLKFSEAIVDVYVQPSKSTIVADAVKRELSSLLFKFNDKFGGVLLAYDFVVLSKLALIWSLTPSLRVSIKANLLLFAPKPEAYLEGKVVKLARESMHIVVLGFSAAVITEENIRDEFKFKIKSGEKVFRSTSHKRHVIRVGSMVRFIVKSFDEEILHISGSLIPPTTGSTRWLSKNSEESCLADRSSRKRAEIEGRKDDVSTGTVDGGALSSDHHFSKKPKKQRIHEGS